MSDLARIDAFGQLSDALTRMHALDVAMKAVSDEAAQKPDAFPELAEWDAQADRVLEAWAVLVSSGLADELAEFIHVRFMGKP